MTSQSISELLHKLGSYAIRRDGAVLHVDVDVAVACALMKAIDAVGSFAIRRDGDVLHVDVNIDIIGSRAFDPLFGCGRIAAYGRLGLRLSNAEPSAAARNRAMAPIQRALTP